MNDVTLIKHPVWGIVSDEFIRTISLAGLTRAEEHTLAWVFRNGEEGLPEEARPLLATAREKVAVIAHWLVDALHDAAEDLFVGYTNVDRSKACNRQPLVNPDEKREQPVVAKALIPYDVAERDVIALTGDPDALTTHYD